MEDWAAFMFTSIVREYLVPTHWPFLLSLVKKQPTNQPKTSLQKWALVTTRFPASRENVPVSLVCGALPRATRCQRPFPYNAVNLLLQRILSDSENFSSSYQLSSSGSRHFFLPFLCITSCIILYKCTCPCWITYILIVIKKEPKWLCTTCMCTYWIVKGKWETLQNKGRGPQSSLLGHADPSQKRGRLQKQAKGFSLPGKGGHE